LFLVKCEFVCVCEWGEVVYKPEQKLKVEFVSTLPLSRSTWASE